MRSKYRSSQSDDMVTHMDSYTHNELKVNYNL